MQWEVELQWTAAPAAARYDLWVWWDEETGWQRLDDGNLTGIAYTHTDVTAGRTYYYTVRAVGANGETGPFSTHAPVTVPAPTTTPTPTSIPVGPGPAPTATPTATTTPTATPTAGGAQGDLAAPALTARATVNAVAMQWEVELQWTAAPAAARYELWVWWDEETGWQRLDDGNLAGIAYTHTDVAAGRTYYYTVRAVGANGEAGPFSTHAPVTVPAPTTTPTSTSIPVGPGPAPTATPTATTTPTATPTAGGAQGDLAVPALTARATVNAVAMQWEVELQWTAAPAAVRYELWVWWDAETGWQRLDGGGLTGAAYMHTDVAAGRTYYYTVRAVGANGETGPYSAHAYVTVSALSAPALRAAAGAGYVTLTWAAVPNAARYQLWVWRDAETGWQRIDDGNLAGVSYTHAGVAAGRTYYYAIRAVGANGETGPWSQWAQAAVPASATRRDEAAPVAL